MNFILFYVILARAAYLNNTRSFTYIHKDVSFRIHSWKSTRILKVNYDYVEKEYNIKYHWMMLVCKWILQAKM